MAELKKVIGYKALLLIVINSIMGTGIFFLPALGAEKAGAASIISWAIMAVFAIYISMCFAELASMFPTAGGIYEFAKQAYGKKASFIVGWLTLIVGNITIAMLIIGAISYLLPPELPQLKVIIMFVSAVFIFLFNFIAYRGMKTSVTMLVTFSLITLGTILALLIPSILRFEISNVLPMGIEFTSIFIAVFFISETFFGWESPTFLAGETKDGARVVPKAIVHGTVIICIIALLLVLFSIGTIGAGTLASSDTPLSLLAFHHFGETGKSIFMIMVYLAIIGSVADWVVSAPRLLLSMAKDRLFIPQFAKVHKKFNTPHRAIIFQCILSMIFVFLALGSYKTLLHMLVPLLLLSYSLVLFAVVILRHKKPDLKRFYKAPLGKFGPIIVIAFFISLLITWYTHTFDATVVMIRAFSLILMGIPVYLLLEMYYNPKVIRLLDDVLAYFTLFTERIALPMTIRKEIVHHLGNLKGKTILEFGCSVGTLTMHLAEEVGPDGRIWATDISKREANIAQSRAIKKGHNHITILHDEQHAYRVHPDIPETEVIVSVGMLGYMQDKKTILKQMNKRLKKGSQICFVDYDKFFDIIPNADWLGSDKQIKDLFESSGFKVSIIRKQGFAWKYIYIFGVKTKEIKK